MAKILLVENDPQCAEVISLILSRHKHEIVRFLGAYQGIDTAALAEFDLLLISRPDDELNSSQIETLRQFFPPSMKIAIMRGFREIVIHDAQRPDCSIPEEPTLIDVCSLGPTIDSFLNPVAQMLN